jgi:hypothetical protein
MGQQAQSLYDYDDDDDDEYLLLCADLTLITASQ